MPPFEIHLGGRILSKHLQLCSSKVHSSHTFPKMEQCVLGFVVRWAYTHTRRPSTVLDCQMWFSHAE